MRWKTFLALLAPLANLSAQHVKGRIFAGHVEPASGALVTVIDSKGRTARSTVANDSGFFSLSLAPGAYTIKAMRIGFRPAEKALEIVQDSTVRVDLFLDPRLAQLQRVDVEGQQDCRNSDGQRFLELWSSARAQLSRYHAFIDTAAVLVRVLRFESRSKSETNVARYDSSRFEELVSDARSAFLPGNLGLTADEVLSDDFLMKYCFSTRTAVKRGERWIGLAFTPTRSDPSGFEGVLWLDEHSRTFRSLEFLSLSPNAEKVCGRTAAGSEACVKPSRPTPAGGQIDYSEINGISLPIQLKLHGPSDSVVWQNAFRASQDASGRLTRTSNPNGIQVIAPILSRPWISEVAAAIYADAREIFVDSTINARLPAWNSTRFGRRTGEISGKVVDSAGVGLAGVTISLQTITRATVSVSSGRFLFQGVPIERLTITVSKQGYTPTTLAVQPESGRFSKLTIRLDKNR
jgi:hypothetical protein